MRFFKDFKHVVNQAFTLNPSHTHIVNGLYKSIHLLNVDTPHNNFEMATQRKVIQLKHTNCTGGYGHEQYSLLRDEYSCRTCSVIMS